MVEGVFNPNDKLTTNASYYRKKIYSKNGNSFKLDIWDTVGQERFRNLNKLFYYDADCIILGYDITNKESFESIKSHWYPTSKKFAGINLFYLIGNKVI